MATYIKNADLFGRIGSGIGQGLAQQLPEEITRGRLQSGLRQLGENQRMRQEQGLPALSPLEQFSQYVTLPGLTAQDKQSLGDILRQQAILNRAYPEAQTNQGSRPPAPNLEPKKGPPSATTGESTQDLLDYYTPPSGPEIENMAEELLRSDPIKYRSIEEARQAVNNQIAGNVNQANAKVTKAGLQQQVQDKSEKSLIDQIKILGAKVPGRLLTKLQQKALNAVTNDGVSPDQAKITYGKEAESVSRTFSNIESWGGLGLPLNNRKELKNAIQTVQAAAKEGDYQKDAADAMIAENNVTPEFAYSQMFPVSDKKELNDAIKKIPDISKKMGIPGIVGAIGAKFNVADSQKVEEETRKIIPMLASMLGQDVSPLAVSYELNKKGYDGNLFKKYVLDNAKELNLTMDQLDELQKPQPSFFGLLNDFWFQEFTGVK